MVSRFGSVDGGGEIGEDPQNPVQSDWQAVARDRFSSLSPVEFDDYVVAPFAESFQVSKQAMRIRLETLGLLRREIPQQRRLAGLA